MRLRILLALMLWPHPITAGERSALQAMVAMTVGDRGEFIDGGRANTFSRHSRVGDRVTDFERTASSLSNCIFHVVGHYRTSYTDKPTVTDVTFTAKIDYGSLHNFEKVKGQPDMVRLKGGNRMWCKVETVDGIVRPEVCLGTSLIDGVHDFRRWKADYEFFRSKVCGGHPT